MLINLRNALMTGGWKNPYVTDGLIAMWDGEWNAGGGVHRSFVSKVFDLSGNGHDLHFSSGFEIGDDYFRNTQDNNISTIDGEEISNSLLNGFTICVVGGNETSDIHRDDTGLINFYADYSHFLSSYSTKNNIMAFRYSINRITYYAPSSVYARKISACYFTSAPSLLVNNQNGSTVAFAPVSAGGFSICSNGAFLYESGRALSAAKLKLKSIRVYNKILSSTAMSEMWSIDKARFNLSDAS